MKRSTAAAAGLLVAAGAMWLAQAGDLQPPGPPAPTMKTLDQTEPRIPLDSSMFPLVIDEGGSYYLTETVVGADASVVISADDVVIDLMGFALIRENSGLAITADGVRNLVIRNGAVRNGSGIQIENASQVILDNLTFNDGGGELLGLISVTNFRVQHCTFVGTGAWNVVRFSSSSNGVIESCQFDLIASGGIAVFSGAGNVSIIGNRFSGDCGDAPTQSHAIEVGTPGGQITGNTIRCETAWVGLGVFGDDTLVSDNVVSNARTGIQVGGVRNVIRDNLTNSNTAFGLHFSINSSDNLYSGNVARGNASDLLDEGTGNNSAGDNYLPGLM